jgi:hypothetical protein
MTLPARAFEDDYVPPRSVTEESLPPDFSNGSRSAEEREPEVDEIIAQAVEHMYLLSPSSVKRAFPPHARTQCLGEVRVTPLGDISRDHAFATQDMDESAEGTLQAHALGLFPEEGFEVYSSAGELKEHDRQFLRWDGRRVERRMGPRSKTRGLRQS